MINLISTGSSGTGRNLRISNSEDNLIDSIRYVVNSKTSVYGTSSCEESCINPTHVVSMVHVMQEPNRSQCVYDYITIHK